MKFTEFCYELYKQDWKKSHRITYKDEKKLIRDCYENDYDSVDEGLEVMGYSGEMYACFEEFLISEFQDAEYMKALLNDSELFSVYTRIIIEAESKILVREYLTWLMDIKTLKPKRDLLNHVYEIDVHDGYSIYLYTDFVDGSNESEYETIAELRKNEDEIYQASCYGFSQKDIVEIVTDVCFHICFHASVRACGHLSAKVKEEKL